MSGEVAQINSAARLLVVDDDENNRDMLSRRLERKGFDVVVAADGFTALKALEPSIGQDGEPVDAAFDLVLLDIEMPGLSGFDVLRRVRQTHPGTRLPVIIATARGDREDVVAALGLGANDYVTKPIDFPVVLARVETQLSHKRAVDRIVALEAEVRRHNQELKQSNARMRHSLELAARVQRSLLPAPGPLRMGHAEFAWSFHPCDELGGDILNVLRLAGGQVGIYLLDVSGHGVPAALLSVALSRMLNCVPGKESLVERVAADGSLEPRPPAEVVAELNRRFPMDAAGGQYFTIFYGLLSADGARLRYVSAGHPPAVWVGDAESPAGRFDDETSGVGEADDSGSEHESTCGVRPVNGGGFAVGWFPDADFAEHELELAPGDRVIIYSDGVTEAMDVGGTRHFGGGRLRAVAGASRHAPLQASMEALVRAVADFRGSGEALDDVTVLALQRSKA